MLVFEADAACLIDELLPDEVKLLSDQLVRVDAVLNDPAIRSLSTGLATHIALRSYAALTTAESM